jgi:hypothetical protein
LTVLTSGVVVQAAVPKNPSPHFNALPSLVQRGGRPCANRGSAWGDKREEDRAIDDAE